MPHLITIKQLSLDAMNTILTNAQRIINKKEDLQNARQDLQNHLVANLFFEPSTRTRISFEIAAKRLGATVINVDVASSSAVKGETMLDTIKNIEAMGVNTFIIRHQDDHIYAEILPHLLPRTTIINAGNGCNEHPTQSLLDMLTIQQHKKNFQNLTIAIIGDIVHSRVAHSNITALQKLNAKEIRLIGPDTFLENIPGTTIYHDLKNGLSDVDVVMLLRIQKERIRDGHLLDTKQYLETYGLTKANLQFIKDDAIIMHAGPLNRNVEMTDEVVSDKRAVMLQQVANGIATRMAVLLESVA